MHKDLNVPYWISVADNQPCSAAGSDTTTSTMQSFCWHVLTNPKVHATLVNELDRSSFQQEVVQYQEALSLPYFQACLKESMRLQPALSFNIVRKVPNSGATISNMFLPGNTEVTFNPWTLHRDKETFGENADLYDPERWLNSSMDQVKKMERSMFQVCQWKGPVKVQY